MKKRILSLLLTACMLVGLLPTAAFAAEPEEELYVQMLELGLVDADGALIEDNTFTVEDGTWLSSLDALIGWLNQCDESDLDTIITVDATGKSATVEQLMYALIIEYQMADVAGQLNTLASGAYAATRAVEAGAVPSYVHNMQLAIEMERSDSIATMTVFLCDKTSGTIRTAPYNIPVEVGAFADFIDVNNANYAADGGQVPGTNSFKQFTIKEGTSSIEFKMDLAKLRTDYLSRQEGLLAGNTFVLFQARTVAGTSKMPDSSAEYCMKIADSTDVDPIINAITGGTIVGKQDVDESSENRIIPYALDWGLNDDTNKKTIAGVNYFKIATPIISAKDSAYLDPYFGWMHEFSRAIDLGMGDAYHRFNLEYVYLWENESNAIDVPYLSVMFNNRFEDIASSSFKYNKDSFTKGSKALEHLYNVALAKNKSWDTPDGAFMSLTAMLENNFEMVTFSNVEVPFTYNRADYVDYPTDW